MFETQVSVLFLIMCAFAQIGIPIFGGLIYETNPALNNTQFAASKYYANNMNDFASAMVTMFELLIVNNWFVLMDGYVAACDSQFARIFFVAYYVVCPMVLFNLVISYVLEKHEEQLQWSRAASEVDFGEFSYVLYLTAWQELAFSDTRCSQVF